MTLLLVMALAFMAIFGLYLATLVARRTDSAARFADGGANLPGWALAFAAGLLAAAGAGLADPLQLTARFGLQASHTGMGVLLAALTAILLHKRLWLAARITGLATPGEILSRYYQSTALRVALLTLSALFTLPFAANLLSQAAEVVANATGGTIGRAPAVWVMAFFIALPAIIGGWRATVLITAVNALVIAVTFLAVVLTALALPGFPTLPIPVDAGVLADQIPGVIQFSAGIGKSLPQGGIFTAVAIGSTALAMTGVVLSPGYLYLGMTARAGRSAGFGAVWLTAGLGGAALLIGLPILAARYLGGVTPLAAQLATIEPFAGLGLLLLLIGTAQVAAGFFTASGAILITDDLILPFILPGLTPSAQRLTLRITLAAAFALVAALAAFGPLSAMIFAGLALPLAVQLFPALLGLCFVRWISRGAILTGLIFGGLMVIFTEAFGLILFEGLFLDLPWGRWPLTVHSALWGLVLNVAAVLVVSIFSKGGVERAHRDRLHDEFAARWPVDFGGPAARGAKWSLTLIWAFFALGPGAILGNTFFSQPIFTEGTARLGLPSLWAWQLFFWLIGVPLVWWLTYGARLGTTSDEGLRKLDLGAAHPDRAPDWIEAGLTRLTGR